MLQCCLYWEESSTPLTYSIFGYYFLISMFWCLESFPNNHLVQHLENQTFYLYLSQESSLVFSDTAELFIKTIQQVIVIDTSWWEILLQIRSALN